MRVRIICLTCLVFGLGAISTLHGANLLYNGSFEIPGFTNAVYYLTSTNNDLPGWSVSGSSSRNVAVHKSPLVGGVLGPNFNFAQDGNYYLDLSGNGISHPSVSAIAQLWQGFSYILSFYIGSASPGPLGPSINVQFFSERTNLNVTLAPAASTGGDIIWTYYEYVVLAAENGGLVTFKDISTADDNASFVDNVKLEPYPRNLASFSTLSVKYQQAGGFPFHPAGWSLTWESVPSWTYQIQYKNTLLDVSWSPLGDPILADWHATTTYVDTNSTPSSRIYRVAGY